MRSCVFKGICPDNGYFWAVFEDSVILQDCREDEFSFKETNLRDVSSCLGCNDVIAHKAFVRLLSYSSASSL